MRVEKDLYYRIEVSYLGINYFGWQKQSSLPTIQNELEEVLKRFLGLEKVWTLATSRTDAGVSAIKMVVLVKIRGQANFESHSLHEIQQSLPGHIKIHSIRPHSDDLQIIQDVECKEYLYFFSKKQEPHYFDIPFVTHYPYELDLELMNHGASLFVGSHHFHNFRSPRKPNQNTERSIFHCELVKADDWVQGKLFGQVYMLKIKGSGFMKNMVRFVMGSLVLVGKKELSLDDLKKAIDSSELISFPLAPAQGLFLHFSQFKQDSISPANRTPAL